MSGGYSGQWSEAFTSAADASNSARSRMPFSPVNASPKPPAGAKRDTRARPPAASRKVVNKKVSGNAAHRKILDSSLNVEETESQIDDAELQGAVIAPPRATNDNEEKGSVYNKERLLEIAKPRVAAGLSLIQGSQYSISSFKKNKSRVVKKATKNYFKPVQRIRSSNYGAMPEMFVKSRKEREREREEKRGKDNGKSRDKDKVAAPQPEWKSPIHTNYAKVAREKIDFRARLREKSRELQAMYDPRELDKGRSTVVEALMKDLDEKEVEELINDIINNKDSPLKKTFFHDIEQRIVVSVPKAAPTNVWLKKPARPSTAPSSRSANAKRAAQQKRSAPSPHRKLQHRSNNNDGSDARDRGAGDDGKSTSSNGRSASPAPRRDKRWTVVKKEAVTSLPLEWSRKFGEKGRRAKEQVAQASKSRVVLAPTGLPEDFVMIMHEMVYNVVERLLNTLRASRETAFLYKGLLAAAVGLDGKIRVGGDAALQRMLTVVGMANKCYSPLEASERISTTETKAFDECYLALEGQEKALLDAVQLVSCTPNHRPMEDLTTVLLWLLSSNYCPDPAVDSDSDGMAARDVDDNEEAFMPIERQGGAALLKTFTRFVEDALRDLVNVNSSAEYRGPDGVRAERSRVGKSKSLCHWHDSVLVDSEEVGAAGGGAYGHIAKEVMASRAQAEALPSKTVGSAKPAEEDTAAASSSAPRSRESRRNGDDEVEAVSMMSSLTLGLEELSSRYASPSKFAANNGNHQSISKTLLGTEVYSPTKNSKLEPARPVTFDRIRKLGIVPQESDKSEPAAAGKALTKFSYDQVQLQVHIGMDRFARAMHWRLLTRASSVSDSQKSTSRLLSKFRGSIATVDCCESSGAEAGARERRGRKGARGDDNIDDPRSTFDSSHFTSHTVYNTERMTPLEKQALFHKLAPLISREQSNMLLTAIVSDTARTLLLCLAVLLKYTAAGKDISTDNMRQLFCAPVVRAVGPRPLQKLYTWLRNNRRAENGFRPAQHLSYLDAGKTTAVRARPPRCSNDTSSFLTFFLPSFFV